MVLCPGFAVAHGGGLNADGCHFNRKTGDYHCHRAPASAPNRPQQSPQQPAQKGASSTPLYNQVDNTCYTGPRGGRYRIVNGKKRYGC
ncbi:YHYH domain-containing protein [Propionivibrio sp.]|uniref:YHYH domain-containing protein n=1 Tax=Propionivibrio sp. TaxID=2212460 RepID=UPI0039E4EAA5